MRAAALQRQVDRQRIGEFLHRGALAALERDEIRRLVMPALVAGIHLKIPGETRTCKTKALQTKALQNEIADGRTSPAMMRATNLFPATLGHGNIGADAEKCWRTGLRYLDRIAGVFQ
jgi:hypothetical protein